MKQDVLVVGAGPVGLTMAAELARYGVDVRIIDKAAQRTDKSKALVLWSRSLELIERMGCAPSFVAAGKQVRSASITGGGRQIAHISFDGLQTPYPYALMLPQSETERLMEQHLNGCGVQVERQVELIRFDSGPDGLRASLRHADGREEMIDAGWMIGCDGAHSLVRHGLGMQFEGETLPSNWILADVHLRGVPGGADEIAAYWHADGPIVLFPISPGRYRVVADVGETKAGERPDDPTLAEVRAVLDQRGPGGITASEPIWLASFVINDRKVADYRSGRVFLAGDAAHIHSPAGGQGMNTGMQDACNLGWKLALVSRGLAAAEPLLASYSSERSEIGRKVLQDAGRATMIATLRSGLLQGIRNHMASLLFGLSPVQRAMTEAMAELSIGYPNGPLTRTEGRPHGGPAAGERVVAPGGAQPVGSGNRPRFALFGSTGAGSAELLARHADLLEPDIRAPLGTDGIWLVRPDDYVAMTAGGGDWGKVSDYLDWIAGAAAEG